MRKTSAAAANLLSAPQCWFALDYRTLDSPDVSADCRCRITRNGVGHGLVVWFDALLVDGIELSNAPGREKTVYGQVFFPWPRAVALEADDTVAVSLRASLVGDDYVWTWRCVIEAGDRPGHVKATFDQSTFHSVPLSLDRLRRESPEHAPARSDAVRLDHFILSAVDGQVSLGEIARRVAEAFPGRFGNEQEALDHVRCIVNRE